MGTLTIKNLKRGIRKNDSGILTALGIIGLGATVVSSIRATVKAKAVIDAENERKHMNEEAEVSAKDICKLVWKDYLPTMILMTSTVACFVGAHSLDKRKVAGYAAAASLSETALKEFKTAAKDVVGENKMKQIDKKKAENDILKHPIEENNITNTGNGDVLFYDSLSGRYFRTSLEAFYKSENELNALIRNCDSADVNELYYIWGIEAVEMAKSLGWSTDFVQLLAACDGVHFIKTPITAPNGELCYHVAYDISPRCTF